MGPAGCTNQSMFPLPSQCLESILLVTLQNCKMTSRIAPKHNLAVQCGLAGMCRSWGQALAHRGLPPGPRCRA